LRIRRIRRRRIEDTNGRLSRSASHLVEWSGKCLIPLFSLSLRVEGLPDVDAMSRVGKRRPEVILIGTIIEGRLAPPLLSSGDTGGNRLLIVQAAIAAVTGDALSRSSPRRG
jgi:hypothetical protein